MGITDKLPLLNSKSKIVKIVGYVLYAFVILMIIGAMTPSEDKATKTASDDSTEAISEDRPVEKEMSNSEKSDGWAVNIISDGAWSGSIGGDGNSHSVDGYGNKLIPIEGDPWVVTAVIQKQDEFGDLKVQLLKDGKVKEESETSSAYGVVSVTS